MRNRTLLFALLVFSVVSAVAVAVLLQEDPGNQAYLARIWQYDIKHDELAEVAAFDPALFTPGAPGFIPRTRSRAGSSTRRPSSGRAGSCSTRRCTRRTPTPSSWSRGSCSRCT